MLLQIPSGNLGVLSSKDLEEICGSQLDLDLTCFLEGMGVEVCIAGSPIFSHGKLECK